MARCQYSCNPAFQSSLLRPLPPPPLPSLPSPERNVPSLPFPSERRPTSGPWLLWSARPSSKTCSSPWATGASASGARARRRRYSSRDMRGSTMHAVRDAGGHGGMRGSTTHAVRIYHPCWLLGFHKFLHITCHAAAVDPYLDLDPSPPHPAGCWSPTRPAIDRSTEYPDIDPTLSPPHRLLEPHPPRRGVPHRHQRGTGGATGGMGGSRP